MKDMKKSVLTACSIAIFSSLLLSCKEQAKLSSDNLTNTQISENSSVNTAPRTAPTGVGVDFTVAAERSLNSVVHIITYTQGRQSNVITLDDLFGQFFGQQRRQPRNNGEVQPSGSGSGVILDKEGYIVTNNHVVQGAEKVKVTLNDKRAYAATIVGTDPSTDLALLKIEAEDLQPIEIGNSDDLRVGEWVLAVGNPFNLTSTVTAGIVSAKGRNLNILSGSMKIESFIQTDAAVNPGNSGGALVNLNGELVGINSAIASQTGSFAGYAFAIPVSIMKKIVLDLRHYGAVQRAMLGIVITDISDELAKANNIDRLDGVYVVEVGQVGGAKDAGMQNGDVIIAVDNVKVKSVAEIQDRLTRFSPGDDVKVTVDRQGEIMNFDVKLRGAKEYDINENE